MVLEWGGKGLGLRELVEGRELGGLARTLPTVCDIVTVLPAH